MKVLVTGWVANFAIRAILGLPITIFGTGKQVREIIYATDLCNARGFKIISPPAEEPNVVKPKIKQNIAIAGILGLMLGVFLAFLMEFWQKSNL